MLDWEDVCDPASGLWIAGEVGVRVFKDVLEPPAEAIGGKVATGVVADAIWEGEIVVEIAGERKFVAAVGEERLLLGVELDWESAISATA